MAVAGTAVFAVLATVALTWAKWYPYYHKLFVVIEQHTLGVSIVTGRSAGPPAPSWQAAVSYLSAYALSVWPALVAGVLIAAAVEAFLPRRWLLAALCAHRGAAAGAVAGGLIAVPTMMCTCCAAPVAVSLTRQGVPTSSALAFWVGNPTLNPATLAFMSIVLPWQWVTVRAVLGGLLVFVLSPLIVRLATWPRPAMNAALSSHDQPEAARGVVPLTTTAALRRFVGALARLSATLVPEYVIIVLLLGGLRGLLFPVGHGVVALGVLGVVVFAVAGTLFAIPTAGEIPVIQGLLAAGVGTGITGALLMTLPSISLPSAVMLGRWFPRRVIVATAGCVVVMGMMGSALLVLAQ